MIYLLHIPAICAVRTPTFTLYCLPDSPVTRYYGSLYLLGP